MLGHLGPLKIERLFLFQFCELVIVDDSLLMEFGQTLTFRKHVQPFAVILGRPFSPTAADEPR
jgi:hypothetical protein